MSKSGKENDSYIQKSTTDIDNDIAIIDTEIQEMSDGACGASTICYRLAIDRTNEVVLHCKGRKCGTEEYANFLVQQQKLLCFHLDLVNSSVTNAGSIQLAKHELS